MSRLYLCWTIDCESSQPGIEDPDLGRNAVSGFSDLLEKEGWKGTFFLIKKEVDLLHDSMREIMKKDHEVAIHTHPNASGFPSPYLGVYDPKTQKEIIEGVIQSFESYLNTRPETCRPGFGSMNDYSFPVLYECGIRQTSASLPGRKLSHLASNWGGAPLFIHYAHPYNRFLEGGLDVVEIPISVDWETMIWGGLHPQDLRIEYTDAKNHSFLIRKIVKRQVDDDLPVKVIIILTHNLFRYADSNNFRRETMLGMIETFKMCAKEYNLDLAGLTIKETAGIYRNTVPFSSD